MIGLLVSIIVSKSVELFVFVKLSHFGWKQFVSTYRARVVVFQPLGYAMRPHSMRLVTREIDLYFRFLDSVGLVSEILSAD